MKRTENPYPELIRNNRTYGDARVWESGYAAAIGDVVRMVKSRMVARSSDEQNEYGNAILQGIADELEKDAQG